jgi:hypothetical protein
VTKKRQALRKGLSFFAAPLSSGESAVNGRASVVEAGNLKTIAGHLLEIEEGGDLHGSFFTLGENLAPR